MAEKKQHDKIVTPVAAALYVYVNKADTKYDKPHGVFRAKAVFAKDSPNREWAEEFRDTIVEMQKKALDEGKKNFKPGKGKVFKGKLADLPVVEDDEGNIVFSFKKKAAFVDENDVVIKTQVPVFDAKGKPVDKQKVMIGNGSQIRVSFYAEPFFNDGVGAGVTLRLLAIQIIALVAYVGEANPEKYGFEEEEGYEFGGSTPSDPEEPTEGGEEATESEETETEETETPEGEEPDAEAQAIINKAKALAAKKPAAVPAKPKREVREDF